MPASEREGVLARRLRQLEEEERALRQSMKEINRQLRRLERGSGDGLELRRALSAMPSPPTTAAAPEPDSDPLGTAAPRRPVARPNERFANYFASGSFVKTRPLGRERRVQRNKAIFMVLFVLLMGYLVFHLVF